MRKFEGIGRSGLEIRWGKVSAFRFWADFPELEKAVFDTSVNITERYGWSVRLYEKS